MIMYVEESKADFEIRISPSIKLVRCAISEHIVCSKMVSDDKSDRRQ
jgi:hypothetical protein